MSLLEGVRRRVLLRPEQALRRVRSRAFRTDRLSDVSARIAMPILPHTPTYPPGPTIVLLNDCRDQDNFGAHALVDGMYRVLMETAPNVVHSTDSVTLAP